VKVAGTNALLYNLTNFLGGATMKAGSNNIPIVAWLGTNRTEMNRTVYMPPVKPQVFLWDKNGNLTNDGQRAYFWDEENRLTGVSSASVVASYKYDAMGRRCQKVVGSTTNTFIYDGWNLIAEFSTAGYTNYYCWGTDLSGTLQGAGGIGGLLCVTRISNGTSSNYFPLADGNGNIGDYLDASGTVVSHREYDPFGRTVVSTGPMKDAFNFWFSTKYLDQETGLYYYGQRFYSASLARWISRDPIGDMAFFEAHPELTQRFCKRRLCSSRKHSDGTFQCGPLSSNGQPTLVDQLRGQECSPDRLVGETAGKTANAFIFVNNSVVGVYDPDGLDWVAPNPNWPPVEGPYPGKGIPWRKFLKGAGFAELCRCGACVAAIDIHLGTCAIFNSNIDWVKCVCARLKDSKGTQFLCRGCIFFFGDPLKWARNYIGCDLIE